MSGGCWGSTCSALLGSLRAPGSRGEGLSRLSHLTPVVGHVPQNLISQLEERIELYTHRQRFLPSARDGGLFERRRQLAPGGPTVAGYPRESTPGRVPWSRARIPAQEALERHTGDPLLDALVQASTGHNAARRPPRPGWSASELRPAPSCTSASAVAAAGPSDGRQSLPSACCRGRARDSCRGAECSGEPGAAWVTK